MKQAAQEIQPPLGARYSAYVHIVASRPWRPENRIGAKTLLIALHTRINTDPCGRA